VYTDVSRGCYDHCDVQNGGLTALQVAKDGKHMDIVSLLEARAKPTLVSRMPQLQVFVR
jgi:hypothetical protein